jgi:hypothetical protein
MAAGLPTVCIGAHGPSSMVAGLIPVCMTGRAIRRISAVGIGNILIIARVALVAGGHPSGAVVARIVASRTVLKVGVWQPGRSRVALYAFRSSDKMAAGFEWRDIIDAVYVTTAGLVMARFAL